MIAARCHTVSLSSHRARIPPVVQSFKFESNPSPASNCRRAASNMATKMQDANRLHSVFKGAKGPSMGCWQMIPGSNVSRMLARTGVDWIMVDCEHGNIDDAQMHEAVAATAACGVSPIVRISDNQAFLVKRALDAGAHGVLVPLLYSVEDAKKLVQAAKFPPQGRRGFGSPYPMEKFHPSLTQTEYLQQANESLLTMVQIETQEALDVVEEIAAVPGIDVLFIGPFDLGNNIGHPIINGVMHDNLNAAMDRIHKAAQDSGKRTGIFCTSGDQAKQFADRGFDMISVATDALILPAAVAGAVKTAQGQNPASHVNSYDGK